MGLMLQPYRGMAPHTPRPRPRGGGDIWQQLRFSTFAESRAGRLQHIGPIVIYSRSSIII